MKNIIFTALIAFSFNSFAGTQAEANLVAKKPTNEQILQFKILKAFKEKRTFYKA